MSDWDFVRALFASIAPHPRPRAIYYVPINHAEVVPDVVEIENGGFSGPSGLEAFVGEEQRSRDS